MTLPPAAFNQPAVQCLDPAAIDNVARAVITLAREVAVLADRVLVLEAVLEARGIPVQAAVETHQPDEKLQQRLDAATAALLANVIATLRGTDGSTG